MLSFRFVAIRTPRGVESTLQGTDAEHVLVEPKFKSRGIQPRDDRCGVT
jgi:hypothetical protein